MCEVPSFFLYKKCYFPRDITDTRANVLYRRCVAVNIYVRPPEDWVRHYCEMRAFWERYVDNINKTTKYIRRMLVGNVFTDYMSFMYAAYPHG
jgi:hypothetical protein